MIKSQFAIRCPNRRFSPSTNRPGIPGVDVSEGHKGGIMLYRKVAREGQISFAVNVGDTIVLRVLLGIAARLYH